MNWADKAIANPQGYDRAVLFPRARDALSAYVALGHKVALPICVCPEIAQHADSFLDVDRCGMAPGTQLYGYRYDHDEEIDLDPLMTGWFLGYTNPYRIVSFGANKILPLVGGGAFLTDDLKMAEQLEVSGFFPGGDNYACRVQLLLHQLEDTVYRKRQQIKMWDRYLGEMLGRIPQEQVMPWNVMRLAPPETRRLFVKALRLAGIAVSTNYPLISDEVFLFPSSYPGGMRWSSSVISFPLHDEPDIYEYEKYVARAAKVIYGIINPT